MERDSISFGKLIIVRALMPIFSSLLVFGMLTSCSVFRVRPEASFEETSQLDAAESMFRQAKYPEAQKVFRDFQVKFPSSIYFFSARIGEGQCSEYMDNPERALEIYTEVVTATSDNSPQIAALAIYRESFAYEKLDEDIRALTTLVDLKNYEAYLPTEIAQVQVPGRMALLYNKLGQSEQSLVYQRLAAENLTKYQGQITPSQVAESYFKMGTLSTVHVNEDNFAVFFQGFRVSELFLMKAIEQNQEIWSLKASDLLESQMKDLWSAIINMPLRKEFEPEAAEKYRRDKQVAMTLQLQEIIHELELRRPLTEMEPTLTQKKLFSYLDKLKLDAQTLVLAKGVDQTPLTNESKKGIR